MTEAKCTTSPTTPEYSISMHSDGTCIWYRDGKLHRDGGPAFERPDGACMWYRDGDLHRDDGPAIEQADGYRAWYRNGLLHREDGPAIEHADGSREWLLDGKYREDGPAIEWASGRRAWSRDDRIRWDSPAIIGAGNERFWYREGKAHPATFFEIALSRISRAFAVAAAAFRDSAPARSNASAAATDVRPTPETRHNLSDGPP